MRGLVEAKSAFDLDQSARLESEQGQGGCGWLMRMPEDFTYERQPRLASCVALGWGSLSAQVQRVKSAYLLFSLFQQGMNYLRNLRMRHPA